MQSTSFLHTDGDRTRNAVRNNILSLASRKWPQFGKGQIKLHIRNKNRRPAVMSYPPGSSVFWGRPGGVTHIWLWSEGPSAEHKKCVWGSLGVEGVRRSLYGQSEGFMYDATTSHDLHLLVVSKPMGAVQVEFSSKLWQHMSSMGLWPKMCPTV